jgi:hypothetical protein
MPGAHAPGGWEVTTEMATVPCTDLGAMAAEVWPPIETSYLSRRTGDGVGAWEVARPTGR